MKQSKLKSLSQILSGPQFLESSMLIKCWLFFILSSTGADSFKDLLLLFAATVTSYTVTYCGENGHGSVVEYKENTKQDMYQVGRSTEPLIDFIVVDTVPGCKDDIDQKLTHSTISRFACRIHVERSSPHRARVVAGK